MKINENLKHNIKELPKEFESNIKEYHIMTKAVFSFIIELDQKYFYPLKHLRMSPY